MLHLLENPEWSQSVGGISITVCNSIQFLVVNAESPGAIGFPYHNNRRRLWAGARAYDIVVEHTMYFISHSSLQGLWDSM